MKSVIKSSNCVPKKVYPYLGILESAKLIVLFIAPNEGIIVNQGDSHSHMGFYSNCWIESKYTPFVGTIELSN